MKTLVMHRKSSMSILTTVLVSIFLFVVGCGEADDDTESESASQVISPPASEVNQTSAGIVEEVAEEPVEEPAAANLCKVGDVLSPGDSCIDPGPGDEFRVLDNGSGQYLFATAGQGIDLQGNINGKLRNFKAERIEGDKWEILSVTPK